ncbi:MAG: hypothetical protein LBN92_07350, partial [Treponema sp.]|nr:hypothetical protein [Treponema sp.]
QGDGNDTKNVFFITAAMAFGIPGCATPGRVTSNQKYKIGRCRGIMFYARTLKFNERTNGIIDFQNYLFGSDMKRNCA